MIRHCDGTDRFLIKEDGITPCDCRANFDDEDYMVVYPHQQVHGMRTLMPRRTLEGVEWRRTKILTISAEVFVGMFLMLQKGEWVGVDGIPLDLQIINAWYDLQMMQFKIMVESKEFEQVAPSSISPEWTPVFHSYSTKDWDQKLEAGVIPVPKRDNPSTLLDPTAKRREIVIKDRPY